MSVEASAWAWRQKISPTAKVILLALADHSDNEGVCWPGQRGIAAKCGLCRETVNRQIQTMVTAGLLTIQARHREDGSLSSNLYCLNLTRDDHRVVTDDHRVVTDDHRGSDRRSQQETSLETSLETSSEERNARETDKTPETPATPIDTPTQSLEISNAAVWSKVLEDLRRQVPKATYDTWLRKTVARDEPGDRLTVALPGVTEQRWVEQKYGHLACRIAQRVKGREVKVEFVVA